MLPFFGFTAYQSSRFGVFQHISLTVLGFCSFCIFCWCLFFFWFPLRGILWDFWLSFAGIYCSLIFAPFFWGCNFFGQQFLCNSSSCEGGVILPPFFCERIFSPKIFLWVLPSPTLMLLRHSLFWQPSGASDLLSVFPGATICRGRWLPLISLVF